MQIPTAREAQDMSSNGSATLAYDALVLGNIATAIATPGTYSCTLTVSSKAGADVQRVRQLLGNLGYRTTQTTTTITILWDNSFPSQLNA